MITGILHDSTEMACQSQACPKTNPSLWLKWDNNLKNEHYTVFSNKLN